jgi:hypothetical protein
MESRLPGQPGLAGFVQGDKRGIADGSGETPSLTELQPRA